MFLTMIGLRDVHRHISLMSGMRCIVYNITLIFYFIDLTVYIMSYCEYIATHHLKVLNDTILCTLLNKTK
jgi:hypothetical protein